MKRILQTAAIITLICLITSTTPKALANESEPIKAEIGFTGPLSLDGLIVTSDERAENLYLMKFKATNDRGELMDVFKFRLTIYGRDGLPTGEIDLVCAGELAPGKSTNFEVQFQAETKITPEERLVLEWAKP
jgi:hypothetical protein